MASRTETGVGAGCAVAGTIVLFVGTYLHPLGADPNDAVAAFAEYAADRPWIASHLTQLAGIALITTALLCLTRALEAGNGAAWARLGAAAATASVAVAAALQAVDGIALKHTVDAWAGAPVSHNEAAFHAAFAVRQIEIGFASMLGLFLGATATLYGAALLADTYPKWLGALAVIGGISTALGGILTAYTGFSSLAMAISMPASTLLMLWMLALAACMWRRRSEP